MVDFHPILLNREGDGLVRARRVVVRLSFSGGRAVGVVDRSLGAVIVNAEQAAEWRAGETRRRFTQRTPFEADTPLAVLMKHVNDPLPLPRKMDPTIPDAVLDRIIIENRCKRPFKIDIIWGFL